MWTVNWRGQRSLRSKEFGLPHRADNSESRVRLSVDNYIPIGPVLQAFGSVGVAHFPKPIDKDVQRHSLLVWSCLTISSRRWMICIWLLHPCIRAPARISKIRQLLWQLFFSLTFAHTVPSRQALLGSDLGPYLPSSLFQISFEKINSSSDHVLYP